jgi:hypothetical protein
MAKHETALLFLSMAAALGPACSVGSLQFDLTGASSSGGHGGSPSTSASGGGATAGSSADTAASTSSTATWASASSATASSGGLASSAASSSAASSSAASSSATGGAGGCTDQHIDGQETDIDCGGPVCPKCAQDKMCSVDTDCVSGFCKVPVHRCRQPGCFDAIKDGDESDVDCGGSCAAKCASGHTCLVSADCASATCVGQVCL